MENFSKERAKDKSSDWKSPAMYTHLCGYKFCIGIDANGHDDSHGEAIRVELWSMEGEYDHLLKWPAQLSFTIELLNQHGGEDVSHTLTSIEWEKPETHYKYCSNFKVIEYGLDWAFLEHSELGDFLRDDRLCFHLTNITLHV